MEVAFLLYSFRPRFAGRRRRRRRRRPSLELSPLGVSRPTETTAREAHRTRIEWYCCYIFSIYDRRKFQGIY